MALTPAQKLTLRTHIQANTTVLPFAGGDAQIGTRFASLLPSDGGDAGLIAAWYNQLTSPAAYAWQFTRSRMQLRRAILNTAGSANQLDALTGSKRDSLLWVVDDTLDTKLPAVRASIDDLCGSQNTLKAAILDSMKRHLTNAEGVFTTGMKSFASPGDNNTDSGLEGTVTGDEILDIKGLPS